MDNNIQVFANDELGCIRAGRTDDGEPWFVAGDVANALGYRMASDMTRRLDEDEKGTRLVRTPGGEQVMSVITEAGLYSAVLGSKVPSAKAFRRWVTHEVLPALRRDGAYVASDGTEDDATLMARAVLAAQRQIAAKDAQIERLTGERASLKSANDSLSATNAALAPKAGFFDSCMDVERWQTFTEVSRLFHQYDRSMTRTRMFELARADGMITKDKQATRLAIDRGYFVNYQPPARFNQETGEQVRPRPYAKFTGKGVKWALARWCGLAAIEVRGEGDAA